MAAIHHLLENFVSGQAYEELDVRFVLLDDLHKELVKSGSSFGPDIERRVILTLLFECGQPSPELAERVLRCIPLCASSFQSIAWYAEFVLHITRGLTEGRLGDPPFEVMKRRKTGATSSATSATSVAVADSVDAISHQRQVTRTCTPCRHDG